MLDVRVKRFIILFILLIPLLAVSACSNSAMGPTLTPQRAVGHFLSDAGKGDFEAAAQWVSDGSDHLIPTWTATLFMPEHSDPITPTEANKIDRFITSLYRITVLDQTDTEVTVSVVFTATDALVAFPSVADDPRVPTSAAYTAILTRTAVVEDEETEYGDWLVSDFRTGSV